MIFKNKEVILILHISIFEECAGQVLTIIRNIDINKTLSPKLFNQKRFLTCKICLALASSSNCHIHLSFNVFVISGMFISNDWTRRITDIINYGTGPWWL